MSTLPVTIHDRMTMPVAPSARPAAASASGLTAQDFLRVVRQHIFMILAFWIFGTAAGIGLHYYLLSRYPLYESKAYIRVDSPFPRNPMVLQESPVASELMNRYVADQAVLMKDEQVLRDALSSAAVTDTEWYRNQPDKTLALERLKEELKVTPITGTSYLSVALSTHSPKDSATIVNTIVDKYMLRVKEASELEYKSELQDYRDQEKRLSDQLQQILAQKQQFMAEKLGTPGVTVGINVVGETLRSMAAEVARLEQEKLQAKAIYENLIGIDPNQIAISPQMAFLIQQDPQISMLQNNKFILEQQLQAEMQRFGENHRTVKDLQIRLEAITQELERQTARKENEVREFQINSANTNFLNAMQAELALRERMLEAEAKQRDLDQNFAQYQHLEEQQQLISNQLDQIRMYANQLQLVIRDRGIVRVKSFPAIPPLQPSFPRLAIMAPAGSLLGLLLGLGLALLLELMDTSLKTSRDIVRHVHVPILGTVPDLDHEELPIEQIELATHTAPRSLTAEAFRTIRTNLLLSSPAERQRTVLITSAKPEEGKTAIAVNLAIALGQNGRRVLLVDANFHRPALHGLFKLQQGRGLSNALIGDARIEDLVHSTGLPNVDVVTSGPMPPNPSELLASSYLREFMTAAAGRYDQIIVDGPPVLLVSDALVLAGSLDGVILVCRAKSVSRGAVQRAREQIERVNGRIFGAVLNAARVRRGGYFKEQIRSYYEYQPEEVFTQGGRALPPGNGDKA